MTEEESRELERQLSCPEGTFGIEIGKHMNKFNMGMTLNTISFLEIEDENSVLELGHGNCGHFHELIKTAKEVKYHGLEISEAMWNVSHNTISSKQAKFGLYDGEEIPYDDNFFHKVMSVNTIYFWSDPNKLISEIERTLRPNGDCVLTFGNRENMRKSPFVGKLFRLYGKNEIKDLVKNSNFAIVGFKDVVEELINMKGEPSKRKYTMVKLRKVAN